ncbi:MAG TPA: thioesterase family protein [Rhodanobacteraceae bacterium]|nr:thioesterase family protein [Rhodanobacteraceae bacterium]HKT84716.1 thioesterase family protein [Novosphingobium sp.]
MSAIDQGEANGRDRASRAEFAQFRSITTRWMDNDVYGHVNNVIYYSFFDTAVNATLIEKGLLDPVSSPFICLVVETGCRYFEPLTFPDEIEAGIRVDRLGNSSVRYGIGLFRKGGELAVAQGHFVHVCVGAETRRPVPFADDYRAFLSSLVVAP